MLNTFLTKRLLLLVLAFAVYPAQSHEQQQEAYAYTETSNILEQFWELDSDSKRGLYTLRTFQPNYVLPYHYTNNINSQPASPTRGPVEAVDQYKDHEMKLQFSFRTKVLEDFLFHNADLWVAYTQTSLWQAWNKDISRPFRSTDHNPDIFYVIPLSQTFDLIPGELGLEMVRVGLAHHSNGQSKPASRSWNYWHVSSAITLGPVLLESTYKHRVNEPLEKDDNPDLIRYQGNLETSMTALIGRSTVSLERSGEYFSMERGNWKLNVTYPLSRSQVGGVRVQLQVFSGYGETLLDYNHRQTRVGIGFLLLNI
ncbi:phospholipase A [Aliidiomarina taiwanensis]|uniref:phospholipase A n=1 Tax=Aliidiomarina taiwanensis TaxID=946228 RepID=UPI0013007F3B|nr:phospholipase A [Aliidiomarina taiwanensis]